MHLSPLQKVFLEAVLTRAIQLVTLLWLSRHVSSWDTAAETLLPPDQIWLKGLLRWDTIHFDRIAREGYVFEQEFAFMPALPAIMRHTGRIVALVRGNAILTTFDCVLGGTCATVLASIAAVLAFYKLSCLVLKDECLARTATSLYCVLPSPATAVVPYNEPWFALCTFLGMSAVLQDRFGSAAIYFAFATAFRANGVLNAGFLIWQGLFLSKEIPGIFSIGKITVLTCLVASLFALVQHRAYLAFCVNVVHPRPWCLDPLPLIYPYVQSEYWNNGFLRYWTLLQLPNFIISMPVLAISLAASSHYYSSNSQSWLAMILPRWMWRHSLQRQSGFLLNDTLLPFVHLHTITTVILIFASHVQTCLRQIAFDPVVFWYAAHLLQSGNKYGQLWLRYCRVWGAVSLVLWAGFFPPA